MRYKVESSSNGNVMLMGDFASVTDMIAGLTYAGYPPAVVTELLMHGRADAGAGEVMRMAEIKSGIEKHWEEHPVGSRIYAVDPPPTDVPVALELPDELALHALGVRW